MEEKTTDITIRVPETQKYTATVLAQLVISERRATKPLGSVLNKKPTPHPSPAAKAAVPNKGKAKVGAGY